MKDASGNKGLYVTIHVDDLFVASDDQNAPPHAEAHRAQAHSLTAMRYARKFSASHSLLRNRLQRFTDYIPI
jgi:hypothetical protein